MKKACNLRVDRDLIEKLVLEIFRSSMRLARPFSGGLDPTTPLRGVLDTLATLAHLDHLDHSEGQGGQMSGQDGYIYISKGYPKGVQGVHQTPYARAHAREGGQLKNQ
jgi:hypothetical protein